MKIRKSVLSSIIPVALASSAFAGLDGYWPITETSGVTADNTVTGGTDASLFNGATFFADPVRGQVLSFDGVDGYADAGMTPQLTLTNDYTWSFWLESATDSVALPNVTILGNRYTEAGGTTDYAPREFTKFTPTNFEYHRNAAGENLNYADFLNPTAWTHVSVVKQANHLISYRNGLVNGVSRITVTQNNAHPLYFGGDRNNENWTGKLDDIAVWSNALPASSVAGLAKGTFNPATAPTTASGPLQTVFSENFSSGLGNWTSTTRGLEQNAPAGYNVPDTTGGQLSLSGTTNSQYWFGNSIESNTRFSSSLETLITVDRISLSGTGSAYRSSLWVLGNNEHYLHYSQNLGETGWQWNARDDGGIGTLQPTGGGNDIGELNGFDTDGGLHSMSIRLVPTGTAGEVNMFMYFDGTLVAGNGFSNFPADFSIALTGQARAINDSVNAVFDNVTVQQVPEPASSALLLVSLLGLARRRRLA
jgi:hypothetical protein